MKNETDISPSSTIFGKREAEVCVAEKMREGAHSVFIPGSAE
jgi:hypothetical protein